MDRLIILLAVVVASVSCISKNVFEFEQPKDGGKQWAFLVAGSNGYFNYRHQADICHAYQILHSHGIPDERIVVMMYDDIADNKQNPVKGNIINRPDGPNVYTGVPIDYKGWEVHPETFLSVLKGEKDKVHGKKVIDSGPNDHIFVNFVDHGGPGSLAFGNLLMLGARKLVDTIKNMYDEKRYSKLVFYVEACESGSMFYDLLPNDINAYATTASNPHESSYACYFDKTRQTYLGDVYSIKWMEDSDKENLNTETLQKQFMITKSETNTSHVQEYGDMSIGDMTVAEFQGTQMADEVPLTANDACEDAVKSEDVPLETLRRRLDLVKTEEEVREIEENIAKIMQERDLVDESMKAIVGIVTDDHEIARNVMETRNYIKDWDCYEEALDNVKNLCGNHLNIPENDYALRKLYMFVNMCEVNIPIATITRAIEIVCADTTSFMLDTVY